MVTLEATTFNTLYAHEIINSGYHYYFTIISQLSFDEVTGFIGQYIQFSYHTQHYKRKLCGYLISVDEDDFWHNCFSYKICLVSSLNILEHDYDYHIYKSRSIKSIINSIFQSHKLICPRYNTHKASQKIGYCVQYSESTYNFIRRLIIENSLCLFYQDDVLIISDQTQLLTKDAKELKISNLKLANYQLWQHSNQNCYSNHPHLHIGNKINNNSLIVEIRHYIDNKKKYHYQYIKYNKKIPNTVVTTPKISGIQLGKLQTNQQAHCDWNHQSETTYSLTSLLPHKNRSPLINLTSIKLGDVIIDYQQQQCKRPFINGYLYNSRYSAPFSCSQENQHYGLASNTKSLIKFCAQSPYSTMIESSQSINNISSHRCDITAKDYFNFTAYNSVKVHSKKIIIKSNISITIKSANTVISVLNNKVIFKSQHIFFNNNGIDIT